MVVVCGFPREDRGESRRVEVRFGAYARDLYLRFHPLHRRPRIPGSPFLDHQLTTHTHLLPSSTGWQSCRALYCSSREVRDYFCLTAYGIIWIKAGVNQAPFISHHGHDKASQPQDSLIPIMRITSNGYVMQALVNLTMNQSFYGED